MITINSENEFFKTQPVKQTTDEKARQRVEKLRQVSEQFESILIRNMLEAMRKTVPEGGLLDRGLELDVFEGMFDDEISQRMSSRHQMGFSDLVFRQLAGKLNLGVPLEEILKNVNKVKNGAEDLKTRGLEQYLPSSTKPVKVKNDSFDHIIKKAAQKYDLDPDLIRAVIKQESNGNPDAVSSKGAKGLMQLIDSTAAMLGVNNVFDAEENIFAGARYLKNLLNQFDNDVELALASYNAGPGNVQRFGGIPPFNETQNYVEKVMSHFQRLKSDEGQSI